MKEATGEANITVITIVLIAIVLAVGTLVVNSVLRNSGFSAACNSAGGFWRKGECYADEKDDSKGKFDCYKADNPIPGWGIEEGEYYCTIK